MPVIMPQRKGCSAKAPPLARGRGISTCAVFVARKWRNRLEELLNGNKYAVTLMRAIRTFAARLLLVFVRLDFIRRTAFEKG
jgi:hypothetical protein